jgi:hypothetical protein
MNNCTETFEQVVAQLPGYGVVTGTVIPAPDRAVPKTPELEMGRAV